MAKRIHFTRHPKRQYICEACGAAKLQWPSQVGNAFFCTHACYVEFGRGKPRKPRPEKRIRISKPCVRCGQPIVGVPSVVNRRSFCSTECQGKTFSGADHHNWRGGSSRWRRERGLGREYQEFRLRILFRDRGICRWCDDLGRRTSEKLEVHHIIPIGANRDLIFDDNNGITLCKQHHLLTKGREDEFAETLAALIGAKLRTSPAPNRTDKRPLKISGAELHGMYIREQMSLGQIAEKCGVTPKCISHHLKRHGIRVRTTAETRAIFRLTHPKAPKPDQPKGRGKSGYSLSPELKEKISGGMKRAWDDPEYRKRVSGSHQRHWTVAKRQAQADRFRGIPLSEEHRQNISAGLRTAWANKKGLENHAHRRDGGGTPKR